MKFLPVVFTFFSLAIADDDLAQKMRDGLVKCYCKNQLVLKSPQDRRHRLIRSLAEIAMYKADRHLGLNMVPTTILKKEANDDQEVLSVCSLWIEPQQVKVLSSTHLQQLVSKDEWINMNIFYFLFGQYDKHFGNQILDRDNKLHLIDNEAVANVEQFVQEFCANKKLALPWVRVAYNSDIEDNPDEPDNLLAVINKPQNPEEIKKAFPYFDQWTNRDIDNGYCKIWRKSLWRQFYGFSDYIGASFSYIINADLLQKLQLLTPDIIRSFWPEMPIEATHKEKELYQRIINKFIDKTLERRDMIIAYFKAHPESIKV